MRHALEWLRRLDGTRAGDENLKKLLIEPRTRVSLPPLPKPLDSKLLLTLLRQRRRETPNSMSIKLYVGNLSFQTSSDDLQQLFAQVGTVESATIVEDRDTGRSRGFGFVEMTSKEEGEKAIEQFNGTDFNGRNLTVNEARPREDRGNRGGGGSGGRGFGGNRGGGGGRNFAGRNDRSPRW